MPYPSKNGLSPSPLLYESADLTEILPEEYQTSEEGADEKSQKKVSETQAVEVEEIRIE